MTAAGSAGAGLRVVSGGQSGVDRAALDAALALGLECGGWCPAGRWAEDGPIPARYPLRETPSARPNERTAWNVRDSDGTLVLLAGAPTSPGTLRTITLARRMAKPLYCARLPDAPVAAAAVWARVHGLGVLNVAGPRESEAPGVQALARAWLTRLLRVVSGGARSTTLS